MKKIYLFIFITIVVIFVSGCLQQQTQAPEKQADKPPASAAEKPVSANTSANTADKAFVEIKNFAFNPDSLTIKSGTTVAWTNVDSAPHTIKSNTFSSGTLGKGETFEFKFESKGTYDYTCGIHPSMKGKIIVE